MGACVAKTARRLLSAGAQAQQGRGAILSVGFRARRSQTATRAADRTPIEKPANYDPTRYELQRRYLAAGGKIEAPGVGVPNGKTDPGSWHSLAGNFTGFNHRYPTASYAERAEMIRASRNHIQGLYWYLGNDPSVPEATRKAWGAWGLTKDEFTDNGGWPSAFYVRPDGKLGTCLPKQILTHLEKLPWQSKPGEWDRSVAEFTLQMPEGTNETRLSIAPLGEIVLKRDQIRILDAAGECWSELQADLSTTQPLTVSVFADGGIVEVFVNQHYSLAARLPAKVGHVRFSPKPAAVTSARFSEWTLLPASPKTTR